MAQRLHFRMSAVRRICYFKKLCRNWRKNFYCVQIKGLFSFIAALNFVQNHTILKMFVLLVPARLLTLSR